MIGGCSIIAIAALLAAPLGFLLYGRKARHYFVSGCKGSTPRFEIPLLNDPSTEQDTAAPDSRGKP